MQAFLPYNAYNCIREKNWTFLSTDQRFSWGNHYCKRHLGHMTTYLIPCKCLKLWISLTFDKLLKGKLRLYVREQNCVFWGKLCPPPLPTHQLVQEIECRQGSFYRLYSVVTLRIMSRSPKSNHLFIYPNDTIHKHWPESTIWFKR